MHWGLFHRLTNLSIAIWVAEKFILHGSRTIFHKFVVVVVVVVVDVVVIVVVRY